MIIIKKFILAILLFLGSNLLVLSQSLNQTIQMADSMVSIQQYELAVKYYLRALYFADEALKPAIYYQLANSYYSEKQYEKAENYYTFVYYTAKKTLKTEVLLKKAACSLYQKKYNYALQSLFSLPDSLNLEQVYIQNLYFATAYYGLEKFDESKTYFLKLISDTAIQKRLNINEIFSRKGKLYRPNPKQVFVLSSIIAGSGQLLYGDLKNSLNSLFLTGGLGLLLYHTAKVYSVFDAFLSVFPWFLRYYQGGAAHAEKQAIQERSRHRAESFDELLEIVGS